MHGNIAKLIFFELISIKFHSLLRLQMSILEPQNLLKILKGNNFIWLNMVADSGCTNTAVVSVSSLCFLNDILQLR